MSKKSTKRFYFFILLLLFGVGIYYLYTTFFVNSTNFKDRKYTFVFIESDDSFEDVMATFEHEGIVENTEAFKWLAEKMDLPLNLHPGKYRITSGMNARQIINLLKYNKQEKVKLTYNSQITSLEEFITYTDLKLELNEDDLEAILTDEEKLNKLFAMTPDNCFGLIVPGSYEVGWAISTDEFFAVLKERYKTIWNATRTNKAKKLGYSIPEIIIMASIVQSESAIASEQSKIAGVYFNRLKKGMPLQADPTLKFANGNFNVQRVLDVDKEINSPYNTYKYKGLPPGPITLVNVQAIDATLNYTKHKYIFFCAKPELNGYSDYSVDYKQHQRFAAAYQKSMNKKGINR